MIILEKFFNSKFMVGLQAAGQKVGANKFLSSVQNAMTSLMAVIMVGAICVILNTLLGPSMLNLIQSGTPVSTFLVTPYQFTMNFLSVWVMALLSYNYAKNLKLKNPLISWCSFWLPPPSARPRRAMSLRCPIWVLPVCSRAS